MPSVFYDNLGLNDNIVLDWPMTEGIGSTLHDISKSGSTGTFIGDIAAWWPAEIGQPYYGMYLFRVWNMYINCPAADTANLNFTTGDYSLACWFNWTVNEYSQILMGKYVLNVSGWELYLTQSVGGDYVSIRHNHAGGVATRTAMYSLGWTENILHCFSMSRTGGTCQHYRNGVPVTTYDGGVPLEDPDSSAANDLRCGVRYTEGSNFLNGYLGRPRAWSRALTADEHRYI